MKVRALIVGIETYAKAGWPVAGPARAAQDVAMWLLGLEQTTVRVDLYIDAGLALDPVLEQECASGRRRLTCHRRTDTQALEDATGDALHDDVEPDTHLLIYWSGHGAISIEHRERLFLCGDYSKSHPGRVINVSQWLLRLRTATFRNFKSHLLLADVCGDEKPIPVLAGAKVVALPDPAPQVVVFASQEGKSTKSQTAGGRFTEIALQQLSDAHGYPVDVEKWSEGFVQQLYAGSHVPYRILVGTIRQSNEFELGATSAETAQHAVSDMLVALGLDRWEHFGQPYLRTVADLGMQQRTSAVPSLSQVIKDLGDFAEASDGVSEALLQFLARIAKHTSSAVPQVLAHLDGWLASQPSHVKDRFDACEKRLRREDHRRILLLVVKAGPDGQIQRVEPYCCDAAGQLIQASPLEAQACIGWEAFSVKVDEILRPFLAPEADLAVSVQFAVEERLLACPFHRIEVAGDELGVQVPVVVRTSTRMFNRNTDEAHLAVAYAKELKAGSPAAWKWKSIALDAAFGGEPWPSVAAFHVKPAHDGAHAPPEIRKLRRVMAIGTPLLHIPHDVPSCGQWQAVERTLGSIAQIAPSFSFFPAKFHQFRTRGEPHAEQATLIWDDPDINPFVAPRGVNDRTSE
jgi:hypothetical protein